MSGVTIREAESLDDLASMLRVFEAVWGSEAQPALNITRAMQHAGGYASVAERAGHVIGASLGFLGRAPDGSALLHSHITAAMPNATNIGIGFALKQHQRAWCLDREITVVTWTFDPLVRRNAYFNLTKLGARATEFHADFYGVMPDAVNAGDETDRILATWDLRSTRAIDSTAPSDGVVVLRIGDDGRPVVLEATGSTLLFAIPVDHAELRQRDPEAGRAWRLAVRATLGAALSSGYVGTGVTADGCYVVRSCG